MGSGRLAPLPSRWERTGRTALSTGKGAAGAAVQFLWPSQDAPDASVGSVCVQGDQDTRRTDSVSLLPGPGGGMGIGGGGVILGTRAACRSERCLPASIHLPCFPKIPDPTWGSQWLRMHDTDLVVT